MQPFVLEHMDCVSHAALVRTAGDGAHKRRRGQPAYAASGGRNSRLGDSQHISAPGADRGALDGEFNPAGITNWNGAKMRQRGAAENAIGGKKRTTYCVQRTSKYARHGPPRGSLRGWWNVERQ